MRAFRAWLRRHHPDVGGDRDTFERGLRAWRARLGTGRAAPGTAEPVTVYRRPRGPIGLLARCWARHRARRIRRRRLR